MWSRRGALAGIVGTGGLVLGGVAFGTLGNFALPSTTCACEKTLAEWCAELEVKTGQRIGVFVLGATYDEAWSSYRADELFAMCSTFKWVLATAVLKAVDEGRLSLSQAVTFTQADILDYAPVVKANIDKGQLSLSELCAATVTLSDNSAANLLLPLIGGPEGLTAFVRSLGDNLTRLDRNEPGLNSNEAGDLRDTTTPRAMTLLLSKIFTGGVLSSASLGLLQSWMVESPTGRDMIRAGLSEKWPAAVVGDKTGRGANGAVNDVAVIWPEGAPPVFISVYTSGGRLSDKVRNEVVAGVARFALFGPY